MNGNSADGWKPIILVIVGAVLAAIAGMREHVDPALMSVAMLIIGGGLGISAPGSPHRDSGSRTRATDNEQPHDGRQSGR